MKKIKKAVIAALATLVFATAAVGLGVATAGRTEMIASADNTNIAAGKKVTSSTGNKDNAVTDGDLSGAYYWEGDPAPATMEVDLGEVYDVTSITPIPYSDGTRWYHYRVFTSPNGRIYSLFAEKLTDSVATNTGDTFQAPNGSVPARYIRVEMIKNSANRAVHLVELKATGTLNTTYREELPEEDPLDPTNVAYGKPVKSNVPFLDPRTLTAGNPGVCWISKYTPACADVDLGQNYAVDDIVLLFPEKETYYNYTVYGSTDGDNFTRIAKKHTTELPAAEGDVIDADGGEYRFIRVYLEYQEGRNNISLTQIRVHGTATGENTGELRTGSMEQILGVKQFSETEYAAPIEQAETIENVYGIIDRMLGKLYREWFDLRLADSQTGNDFFRLSDSGGKIRVEGNTGVCIAAGINYYLKNYAKVNITEQANQVRMPQKLIPVGKTVVRETPYKVRYAFNYCTMDYSFAFFDEADFQREYDWLALNGVTVALDLAGQEAVWIRFLMNFGYSYDAAKSWLTGPAYQAWQFMQNMEIYGGPLPDGWVTERLESARRMQRWRLSLGMQTCLQGYTGMVPNDFRNYKDIELLEQGTWNYLDRPEMMRTDSPQYDEYSRLFYEAQKWAFGDAQHYYAADPFHEGGIHPTSLTDDIIAQEVMQSLLEADPEAVWVIQAWHSNPTNKLLHGLNAWKDEHVLILDLCGLEAPKWNRTTYGEDGEGGMTIDDVEFNGTPWVWCMLENYGGNPSMDGELADMIKGFTNARQNAGYLRGIGMISEASLDNPVLYNLLYDLAWGSVDLDSWLDSYVEARYGRVSESARAAWDILTETLYNKDKGWYVTLPYVVTMAPENLSLAGSQSLKYDIKDLYRALYLLLRDYDTLCASEGYRYDLVELMRQIANDNAIVRFNELASAYRTAISARDVSIFNAAREKFEGSFTLMNEVLGCRREWMLGEWLGRAQDWGAFLQNDFATDCFVGQMKTIITSWADQFAMMCIPDYARRTYEGSIIDLYLARWKVFLDKLADQIVNGGQVQGLATEDYYHVYRAWAMKETEYSRQPQDSSEHLYAVAKHLLEETGSGFTLMESAPVSTLAEELSGYLSGLESYRYSEEQLALFADAEESAKALLSGSLSRSEYFAFVDSLEEVYSELASPIKEADPNRPSEPIQPSDPTDPTDPTEPTDPQPQTPDEGCASVLYAGGGSAIALLTVAGALFLTRRKKRGE